MKRIGSLLVKNKLLLFLLFLVIGTRSILVVFLNNGYADIIDSIFSFDKSSIIGSSMVLIIITIAQIIIIFSQDILGNIYSERIAYKLRESVFVGLLKTTYENVVSLNSATSISKLNIDLDGLSNFIRGDLLRFVCDTLIFVAALVGMILIDVRLTIISIALLPFISYYSYKTSQPIAKYKAESNKASSKVYSLSCSITACFPIIKLFQMKRMLLKKSENAIASFQKSEEESNIITAKIMSLNSFISYLPLALMWGFGGYYVIAGRISPGALLAFTNLSNNYVGGLIQNLPDRINGFRGATANTNRLLELLEKLKIDETIRRKSDMKDNTIKFSDVAFEYEIDKSTIKNLDFTIHENTKTAIIGESGSGKTTIMYLLAGLYNDYTGDINFFGKNLKDCDVEQLRENISYITQEPYLFPVSIRENICCGQDYNNEILNAATKNAQLEDLVNSLPDGLDSIISENGNNLSGGERQRICITRAFAKILHLQSKNKKAILLIDEATSSLDVATEGAIISCIDDLKGSCTIIFITHKLKNAVNSDKILCMKDGSLISSGTHESLIKENGYYSKLWRLENLYEVIENETF